jgi:hypothetical protein
MPALRSEVTTESFSLVAGGPLYQFFLRTGLLKPPLDRTRWRILVVALVTWAPLLVLTMAGGRLISGVHIPFARDFEVHVRLLVSLPLMIAAEVTIHGRLKMILGQFIQRRIIAGPALQRFGAIIESAMRLRNSVAVELILLGIVLLAGRLLSQGVIGLHSDTWGVTMTAAGAATTPAGIWYQFVSVPISQFLLLRWYFRLFIWIRMLWQISRLELNLVATHPDRACGLGFLDGTVLAMAPLLLAHTSMMTGALANRLVYEGAKLPDYYVEIVALALFLVVLTLGPLCLFTRSLLKARLLGLATYGRLASDYVIGFDRKWIAGERPADEPLVGSGDIQSLADLANSFQVVQSIVPFPFGRSSLLGLAAIIAGPMLPLSLTMFSPQELLLRLLRLLF